MEYPSKLGYEPQGSSGTQERLGDAKEALYRRTAVGVKAPPTPNMTIGDFLNQLHNVSSALRGNTESVATYIAGAVPQSPISQGTSDPSVSAQLGEILAMLEQANEEVLRTKRQLGIG